METVPFPKHYKSPSQLVELLKSRGLTITDEGEAEANMCSIGYYRLSAYLYPLLAKPKHLQIFKPQSNISTALSLYRFDHELRMLLFDAIAKIEVAIRSAMANIVAKSRATSFG